MSPPETRLNIWMLFACRSPKPAAYLLLAPPPVVFQTEICSYCSGSVCFSEPLQPTSSHVATKAHHHSHAHSQDHLGVAAVLPLLKRFPSFSGAKEMRETFHVSETCGTIKQRRVLLSLTWHVLWFPKTFQMCCLLSTLSVCLSLCHAPDR